MAEPETRTRLQVRLDTAVRLILWHCFSGSRPFYLVSEFPKSGGSWVSQMLAAYLEVPFPRNQSVALLRQPPSILHGHHLHNRRFRNAVYVMRDGRDVMVSAYYDSLFTNDRNARWAVDRVRAELGLADYDDVEANLPAFIDYMFTAYPARSRLHFSWSQFVDALAGTQATTVRYEDLLSDTPGAMRGVLERLTGQAPDTDRLHDVCDRFSFARQTQRQPGAEDTGSFLRKGIAGDWKTKFTRKAREVFDRHAGQALIDAGYEPDRSWVEAPGTS